MNNRRGFLWSSAGTVAASAFSARAQTSKRLPVVGMLGYAYTGSTGGDAFVAGLRELGWVEGRTVTIERRYDEGNFARMPVLVAELVKLAPDVIVAVSSREAVMLRKLTNKIPIVIAIATDPIGIGLIESYRRPGGNVTGLVWDQEPGVTAKYVEFLKDMIPKLRRLGCLIDPSLNGIAVYRGHLEAACAQLGVSALHREIRTIDEIGPAVEALASQDVQALFCYGSPFTFSQLPKITAFAAKFRLPDMYIGAGAVRQGGLMSYGPDQNDMQRRAADYVDRILRGANPAELPMALPTKYEFAINRATANRLGLKFPPSLLALADIVIE